ncbi:MAG: hypothetical protein WCJ25_00960 [Candidatus Moraniibacteriota bacterium]
MIFITFSGTDGSGKSTQLTLLREHFEKNGKKVAYFHAVEFSLANRLKRKVGGKNTFTPGSEKASIKTSLYLLLLRKLFLVIDIYRFRLLVKSLQKDKVDILLSDRYFYDSVVNIEYLSGSKAFHRLDRMITRPDFAIFLDVSPDEIMKRDRAPEQGIEYVSRKRDLFLADMNRFGLIRIDADKTKEETFLSVMSSIEP